MTSPEQPPSGNKWESVQLITGCLVVLIGIGFVVDKLRGRPDPTPSVPPPTAKNETGPSTDLPLPAQDEEWVRPTIDRLVRMNWGRAAATSVVQWNQRYLSLTRETSEEQFDRRVKLWGRLGDRPIVQKRLEEWPELTGLLMRALEQNPDGPELILKSFSEGADPNSVRSMYGFASTPEDSIRLAQILERDGDLVVKLWKIGVVDAAEWFSTLPKNADAQSEYRKWLRSIFESVLQIKDDEARDVALGRAQTLLTIHEEKVRGLLDEDDQFRRTFLSTHWPRFRSVLNRKSDSFDWIGCVVEPRVWQLLMVHGQSGADKFDKYGAVAIDLLLCPEYRTCVRQVFEAFDHADERAIDALFNDDLRQNSQFIELLGRDLSGATLATALHTLTDPARSAEQPALLAKWSKMTAAGLKEELGPPPQGVVTWLPGYSVYYVGRKYATGREIDTWDVIAATVDAAGTVIIFDEALKGAMLVRKGLQKSFEKGGMQGAAKWATNAAGKELYPWVIRDAHRAANKASQTAFQNLTQIDVTDAVQFAFKRSDANLSTFKRISTLDARIFMRADRRVVFAPVKILGNRIVGPLLIETATGAGFEVGVKHGLPATKAAVKTVVEQERAWRQHLGLWWLVSNDGSLEPAVK